METHRFGLWACINTFEVNFGAIAPLNLEFPAAFAKVVFDCCVLTRNHFGRPEVDIHGLILRVCVTSYCDYQVFDVKSPVAAGDLGVCLHLCGQITLIGKHASNSGRLFWGSEHRYNGIYEVL